MIATNEIPKLNYQIRTSYSLNETKLLTRDGEFIEFDRICKVNPQEQLAILYHLITIRIDDIRKSPSQVELREVENVRDAIAALVELPF